MSMVWLIRFIDSALEVLTWHNLNHPIHVTVTIHFRRKRYIIFIHLFVSIQSSVSYCWCLFAVADMLLWKNKKQTLTAALALIIVYYNFVASGYTIITAFSKLLLATSIFLFIHGILPDKLYVWAIPPLNY